MSLHKTELALVSEENNVDLERFDRTKKTSNEGRWDWCGPRAVANIINYHIGNVRVSLEEIMSAFGGPPYWPRKVESALNHFAREYGLDECAKATWHFDINTVVEEIDAGRPLVLFTFLGGPWRIPHNTVLVGYKVLRSDKGRITKSAIRTFDYGWVDSDNTGILRALTIFNRFTNQLQFEEVA
jgi:hypothetical protein